MVRPTNRATVKERRSDILIRLFRCCQRGPSVRGRLKHNAAYFASGLQFRKNCGAANRGRGPLWGGFSAGSFGARALADGPKGRLKGGRGQDFPMPHTFCDENYAAECPTRISAGNAGKIRFQRARLGPRRTNSCAGCDSIAADLATALLQSRKVCGIGQDCPPHKQSGMRGVGNNKRHCALACPPRAPQAARACK
jgi:hypothetical protein